MDAKKALKVVAAVLFIPVWIYTCFLFRGFMIVLAEDSDPIGGLDSGLIDDPWYQKDAGQ